MASARAPPPDRERRWLAEGVRVASSLLFAPLLLVAACASDADLDGIRAPEDCNDADPAVFPGARERCNTVDDDCDGDVDEAAADAKTWYADADGDGQGPEGAASAKGCTAPPGFPAAGLGDCDDTHAAAFTGAVEVDNRADDDCDGRIDEDPIDEGLVFLTEIARQPRFGGEGMVVEGQWFEVHNASAAPVDLAGAQVVRESAIGTDAFHVSPARPLVVAPGGYVVFCKTELRAAANAPQSTLRCDYVWGDPGAAPTWSSAFHDNTFNLQRDTDSLALYVDGDAPGGRLVDRVAWTYDPLATWPREATRSMALDPGVRGAAANDTPATWCSASPHGVAWWDGPVVTAREFGTPGSANPPCEPG